MKNKDELIEIEDKLIIGFKKTYQKMIEFKKQKKTPIVYSKNGKVLHIKPEVLIKNTI